ncbi:MAG: hypothetical protein KatS3mg006_0476 [Pyrinomonadaceae bacterium]|jgi:cyclophilin family peptidyl-prolyl cis-trans isomerase/HEAT repeat protein|nr:MAG: hypothetical protein KatS3mg006_0476 [Pyrinomonadaceae bacterium]
MFLRKDFAKPFVFAVIPLLLFSFINAQNRIPTSVILRIVRAEDERRFDDELESLLKSKNPQIRKRAALAAGRIGDEKAVEILKILSETDPNEEVRLNAIFALGEIESVKASDTILKLLKDKSLADTLRSRAVEAAGKIAMANPKTKEAEDLGEAILDLMESEEARPKQSKQVILLGLTAIFRARPENGDLVVMRFLTNLDARIRADAANALARMRSKIAVEQLQTILLTDSDAIARANAARALGVTENKTSVPLLLEAALGDDDLRVRVSSIRALATLEAKEIAPELLKKAQTIFENYKESRFRNPIEQNELFELISALGSLLSESNNKDFLDLIGKLRQRVANPAPEIEIAFAKVSPLEYLETIENEKQTDWRYFSAVSQALEAISSNSQIREKALKILQNFLKKAPPMAQPNVLSAFASFKSEETESVLIKSLESSDVFIRTAAAELLAKEAPNEKITKALEIAFKYSMQSDTDYDDAQIAILSALTKLDKEKAIPTLQLALSSPNFLVRRHAANLIKQNGLTNQFSDIEKMVGIVKPHSPNIKTKLGQVTNKKADYLRAISRRNGTLKAIVTTEKGDFTISLMPEEAPLTVDNFIKLARKGYFDGLEIHRVVPNFVIQDGDPRGDSNGGPGWQIRCEINMLPYDRGAVGMALSGKDTGGSQWFITHSPQPHLDGGYTVFGYVNENDMKVVDSIVRWDKILKVRIVETSNRSIKKKK